MAKISLKMHVEFRWWFKPAMRILFTLASFGMLPPERLLAFMVDHGVKYVAK